MLCEITEGRGMSRRPQRPGRFGTPLTVAVRDGNVDCAKTLLLHGAAGAIASALSDARDVDDGDFDFPIDDDLLSALAEARDISLLAAFERAIGNTRECVPEALVQALIDVGWKEGVERVAGLDVADRAFAPQDTAIADGRGPLRGLRRQQIPALRQPSGLRSHASIFFPDFAQKANRKSRTRHGGPRGRRPHGSAQPAARKLLTPRPRSWSYSPGNAACRSTAPRSG
jgi:hypothetical protein